MVMVSIMVRVIVMVRFRVTVKTLIGFDRGNATILADAIMVRINVPVCILCGMIFVLVRIIHIIISLWSLAEW